MESLQSLERSCRGFNDDDGKMQEMTDTIKYQEVHFMTPFGILLVHIVCKQGLLVDPCQDCSDCQFTTTKISMSVERNIGTHKILQEIHKRVCTDKCIYGENVEEG
jgi:hypothetical protein